MLDQIKPDSTYFTNLNLDDHKKEFDNACKDHGNRKFHVVGIIIDHVRAAERQKRETILIKQYSKDHNIPSTGRTTLALMLCKIFLGKDDKGASLHGRAIAAMVNKNLMGCDIERRFDEVPGGWDGWARTSRKAKKNMPFANPKAAKPRATTLRVPFPAGALEALKSGKQCLVQTVWKNGYLHVISVELADQLSATAAD